MERPSALKDKKSGVHQLLIGFLATNPIPLLPTAKKQPSLRIYLARLFYDNGFTS